MFNSPTRPGFSKFPRPTWNKNKEKMAAPNNAYYVLTVAHAGLPNSVLFTPTANTWLATKDTGDLTEGANLYYTDARVGTYGDAAYLKLDGSNANSNIDIGAYDFTTTGNCAFGNVEPYYDDTSYLGHPSWRWKSLYLSDDANIGGNATITGNTTITTTGIALYVTGTSAPAGLDDVFWISGGTTGFESGPSMVFNGYWGDGSYPNWRLAEIGAVYSGGIWGGDLIFLTNDGTGEANLAETMRINRQGDILADGRVAIGGGVISAIAYEKLLLKNNANHCWFSVETYSDTITQYPAVNFKHSHSDTLGTKVRTINGENLGVFNFMGCDSGNNFDLGADIQAIQVGASGVRVPTSLRFRTANSSSLNAVSLTIKEDGDVSITDLDVVNDFTAGTIQADDGFTGTGAYTNFTIVGGIITAAS